MEFDLHQQRLIHSPSSMKPTLKQCSNDEPPLPSWQLTYLPPPWGECESKALESGFFQVYSVTACRIDCETRYIVENCNCRMVHMPGEDCCCCCCCTDVTSQQRTIKKKETRLPDFGVAPPLACHDSDWLPCCFPLQVTPRTALRSSIKTAPSPPSVSRHAFAFCFKCLRFASVRI